jgi:hypothetical protein
MTSLSSDRNISLQKILSATTNKDEHGYANAELFIRLNRYRIAPQ